MKEAAKKTFYKKFKKEFTAYSLLIIPILWWGVFFLFAFVRAVYFSFTDMRFAVENITAFNFDNYVRLFQDKTFHRALLNTGIWTAVMTSANNILGLTMAFFVLKLAKGRKLFLALLFWPTLVSAVTGAEIIKLVFNPSETGLMNVIIKGFGGSPSGWYNDPKIALLSLMIIPTLFGFSMQMMLYYVALIGVPKQYVEAARLETNSQFKVLWHVYLPLIKNTVSVNLVLSIISDIKVLGPMQLAADGTGGPLDSTMSIMLLLFNKGITGFEMGYACAIGVIALLIILSLTFIQRKLTGKGADYD